MNVLLYRGRDDGAVDAGRPVHAAPPGEFAEGTRAVVSRLLEAGSKAGLVTDTGVQPIHLAAQAGSADAVKALLDRGADVNARDATHGRTPLVFAVSQNRLDAMKVLIAKGADVQLATNVIDYRERATADNQARRSATASSPRPDRPRDQFEHQSSTIRRRRRGAAAARRRGGAPRAGGGGGRTGCSPRPEADAGGGVPAGPRPAVGHRADRPSGRLHRAALRRA